MQIKVDVSFIQLIKNKIYAKMHWTTIKLVFSLLTILYCLPPIHQGINISYEIFYSKPIKRKSKPVKKEQQGGLKISCQSWWLE